MKIFVLNNGSSSMKCSLFSFDALPDAFSPPLWQAHAQWGSLIDSPFMQVQDLDGTKYRKKLESKSIQSILNEVLHTLPQNEIDAIDVVGHRIVHGGNLYRQSIRIRDEVKSNIAHLSELAPLHNEADVEGIQAFEKLLCHVPQIAVFDTAFHHTLPEHAKVYPLPYEWYRKGIERYGFHGTSYQYCLRRAHSLLSYMPEKTVICHLGSGASLCAIKEGKSIDTTMGFTPLEGLMMDTRSGSVDPGILLYQLRRNHSSLDQLYDELYRKSGLLGVSGMTSDMKDIIEMSSKNERASLAFGVYLHRLNSCLGSMIASLQGLDALIFTAGIGENAPKIREGVCENFSFLGLKLDKVKNDKPYQEDCELSLKTSTIKVLLLHTEEAFEIARESYIVSFGDRSSS